MPNTTYFYRAVSYASPPSISREYSFTTRESAETIKHWDTEILKRKNTETQKTPEHLNTETLKHIQKTADKITNQKQQGKIAGEKQTAPIVQTAKTYNQKQDKINFQKRILIAVAILFCLIIFYRVFLIIKKRKKKK